MRWAMLLMGFAVAAGCAKKSAGPIRSHGKTADQWIAELGSGDAAARKKAVQALGHFGKADPAALPAVISALKDADATVRDAAVIALLNLGPDARDAIAPLEEVRQGDSNPGIREHATRALERIRGG
jgi:HEAT repeat protein